MIEKKDLGQHRLADSTCLYECNTKCGEQGVCVVSDVLASDQSPNKNKYLKQKIVFKLVALY